ncbi:MAG: cytidine deaminase, partial [Pseudomonadota bacterium]
ETKLTEVYVVASSPQPVPPCGGCRQKLSEFGAGDVVVTMATVDGTETAMTIGDLLPGAFGPDHMKGI